MSIDTAAGIAVIFLAIAGGVGMLAMTVLIVVTLIRER